MQPDFEQRAAPLMLAGSKLTGYPILFDTPSADLGGFVEIVLPSAVDRTFNEQIDVRALAHHDDSKVLGRVSAGTLTLTKDARGLRADILPPDNSIGHDVLESVRRGDVSSMSFTFAVLRPGGERFEQRRGITTRLLSDLRIREVSVVSFPAYAAADVTVAQRSLRVFLDGQRVPGAHHTAALRRRHTLRGFTL